jgi:predicted nucleic acid-binding protein
LSSAIPRLVVDASIVVKWTLDDEDHIAEARSILRQYQQGSIDIVVPEHLIHEVINTLVVGVRRGRISLTDAKSAVSDVFLLAMPTASAAMLADSGFDYAFRYGPTFYDAQYLALADLAGCPFVHADRRLHNTLAGRFPREVWIEDYEAS